MCRALGILAAVGAILLGLAILAIKILSGPNTYR